MQPLDRLLRPASIAVIGGGTWCESVIRECRKFGFDGPIWAVHPARQTVGGAPAYPSVDDLPEAPDASFIGVNRHATVEVVRALAKRGAGGAVCFASGFQEAVAETEDGADLQAQLLAAAGDMRLLGPNCYGFINALGGVALWPDQHGLLAQNSGVALVTQSSNIALNLTMQARALPIAYLVTVGNQAQTDLAELGAALLADPKVTCLGVHIEGIGDLRAFEALAATARALEKPIVMLKVGRSEQAQAATISHTASLAGSDTGACALADRLGIAQTDSLPEFLETLKLLHIAGPLGSNRIASMSCSGGEASLMADSAHDLDVTYPPLDAAQTTALRAALGPKVALANPLDYHTYIWGDLAALTRCYSAMMQGDLGMGCVVLDFPRADRCTAPEWDLVIEAVAETQAATAKPMAILASLPETMPEDMADRIAAKGITPLIGMREGLKAMALAAKLGKMPPAAQPLLLPCADGPAVTLTEAQAKDALAQHGLAIPRAHTAASAEEAAQTTLTFPVALKGQGIAHKTEARAVALSLRSGAEVQAAANAMPTSSFLVEEMIADSVAELLIGVIRDPAHGYLLTLGAGGTLTELLGDTQTLLIPAEDAQIDAALDRLRVAKLLGGYRGAPKADRKALLKAIRAVQDFVTANAHRVLEVEINPLICTPTRAVAADALIRWKESP